MSTKTRKELEREARILADQADRFISQFAIDVSDAETFAGRSEAFRTAADAFERIALAEKRVDQAAWYRAANVNGRTSKDIMDRLWNVRTELRRIDEEGARSKPQSPKH